MLIGREAHCAGLSAALSSVRAGHGDAIVLMGNPGIGKTTLLHWLGGEATNVTVLQARGVEIDAELPYADLIDLLTPILDRLDSLPGTQSVTLAAALGLGPPVRVGRFAVGVALLGLLSAAAEGGALLMLVDDLQWIDRATCEALSFAVRRLGSLPVLLVAAQQSTSAGEAVALPRARTIAVQPLGQADAVRLLGRADSPIAPRVADRIVAAARGNPLALVELPDLLTAGQLAGTEVLANPMPIGNGLERAFTARMAPLSAPGRRAVVVVSADTSGTAGVVLEACASLGLGPEPLREAEAMGLLTLDADRLEFRHPLVRSAAYHGADAAERRRVHAALAQADSDEDRSVWHRAAATLGPDDALATDLEAAGERALARGAFSAGALTLERAASFTKGSEDRGACLFRAAEAMDQAGNLARSEALAQEAARLVVAPVPRAQLVLLLARLLMTAGRVEAGHAMLMDEASRITGLDPGLGAAMYSLAANLAFYRLDARTAVELTDTAWALGDPARLRTPNERNAYALARAMAGDANGALLLVELAVEAGREPLIGHRMAAAIGWPLVWVEEYEAARVLLTWAVTVERAGGSLRHLPQSLAESAELNFRLGRWLPALADAHEAMALFEETDQPIELGFVCATAARIEAALGREDDCRQHAKGAFAADAASGLLLGGAYAGAALGLLELARGDMDAAVAALAPVERVMRAGHVGEPWIVQWAPDLIEAHARGGRADRAGALLSTFEAQAQLTGRVSALAAAARCRGMLARETAYDEQFTAALALHDLVPTPFERGRTELAYGERLRRAGRRTDARELLNAALLTLGRLGAEPWAERARSELRASGQSVLTPEQRSGDALTPQELHVAALVAAGSTNREAAASLSLSTKTIEFHLGNVYRKLGVRSRTELARAVAGPH